MRASGCGTPTFGSNEMSANATVPPMSLGSAAPIAHCTTAESALSPTVMIRYTVS